MKKLINGLVLITVLTVLVFVYLKYNWSKFDSKAVYTQTIKTNTEGLEEVASKWVEQYTNYYKGILVPYSHRIEEGKIKSIEILDISKGYVQIDYLFKPVSNNNYVMSNFEAVSGEDEGWLIKQVVVRFEKNKDGYVISENMRPVNYQIMSDPDIMTRGKEGHVDIPVQKDIDYVVKDGILNITFDKGVTLKEVPIDYKFVTYDPSSATNEIIPEGSYVISQDYTAFLYVDKGLKIIYSFDQGQTWNTEIVSNKENGYYRARFLSKTENFYYVVYSTDKAMSAEGHGFSISNDGIHFTTQDFQDPEQRVMTYAYFTNDDIGYVAYKKNEPGNSRSFYLTTDGGQTFTPIDFELREVTWSNDYVGTPFIQVDKIFAEDGKIHIIVGQGEYGDYGHALAEYISDDGFHFSFYKEIQQTSRKGG